MTSTRTKITVQNFEHKVSCGEYCLHSSRTVSCAENICRWRYYSLLPPLPFSLRKFHRDDKKIHGDDLDYNYIYGEDDEEDYGTKLKDKKYEVDDPLYGQHVVRRDTDERAQPRRNEITIRSGERMYLRLPSCRACVLDILVRLWYFQNTWPLVPGQAATWLEVVDWASTLLTWKRGKCGYVAPHLCG